MRIASGFGGDKSPRTFTVRCACASDEDAFARIEAEAFGRTGVEPYGKEHFRIWLRVHPEAFLVAEHDGDVVGYTYSQRVNFDWGRLCRYDNYDRTTDLGYTVETHVRNGNAFQGVSIASVRKGAGRALFDATFRLMDILGLPFYVGLSRIPGLAEYARSLAGTPYAPRTPEEMHQAARLYALKCAMMAKVKVWTSALKECDAGLLPEPERPDPVLTSHLQGRPDFGLARVVPNCMHDEQSLNYAAVIVRQR